MTVSTQLIETIIGGSGAAMLFNAWAKHIPDWPLSWAKLWEWFRGTAQEVASQRSGQYPTTLANPAQEQK